VAYRADIEIGVKGIRYLDELQNRLTQVSKSIEDLNRKSVVVRRTISGQAYAEPAGPGFAPGSRRGAVASARAVEQTVTRQAQQRIAWEQKVNAVSTGLQKELNSLRVKHNAALYRLEQRRVQRIADQERKAAEETARLQAAASKKRTERISGVALGAGFPLLFGGGPGAVLGGAAGGLIGGPAGFAAQIAFSAVGQQIDTFVAEVAKTGVALTSASGTFELVKEKSLFSSEAVKKQAYELEELGKVQELAALLTTDLAKQIGGEGVRNLQRAGDETEEFTRLVNLLFTQLSSFVAGPLADFLSAINTVLGGIATDVQFGAFQSSLEGAQATRFAEIVAEERGGKTTQVRGSGVSGTGTKFVPGQITTAVRQRALQRAEQEGIAPRVTGRTTFEDTQTIRPPKGRSGRSSAEREAERVAKLLREQQLTTRELELQLSYSERIFAAEQAKDPVLAARLKGEQRLAELGIETARRLENEVNTSAQLAIAKEQQAKGDLLRLETQQQVEKIEAQRAEKAADYLRDLEYQLELNNAVSKEAQTEIEIRKELADLRKQGITDETTLLAIAQARRALAEPTELRDFIRSATSELNNLQIVAVRVSQGIGNAIAGSMIQGIQGLIEGTQTAKEVFSNFLKSVGQVLIEEGTRMIATYIAIGIARIFAGLASGGSGGGNSYSGGNVSTNAFNSGGIPGISNTSSIGGNYFPTSTSFANASFSTTPFASGGFVTGPTRAMVGEGGESEYIIPASKMAGAMARYSAGARGSNVIPDSSASGGGMSSGGHNTYTLETVVINNVEYATVEQVREFSALAARQGAEGGYNRSMSTLRNSRSQRSRIGLR